MFKVALRRILKQTQVNESNPRTKEDPYRDGREVKEENALRTPTGSLAIHHVTEDNEGLYHCEARNELLDVKTASKKATLSVTSKCEVRVRNLTIGQAQVLIVS